MKQINLGQALSILANVGVLAGILLLVYELNQTRMIAQAEFVSDGITAFQEIELATIGPNFSEIWAKALSDPAGLSIAEIKTLDAYLINILTNIRRTWVLEQYGFRTRGDTMRSIDLQVPFYFGNEIAQRWWNESKAAEDPEFAALLDASISSTKQSYSHDWLEGIRPEINNEDPGTVLD